MLEEDGGDGDLIWSKLEGIQRSKLQEEEQKERDVTDPTLDHQEESEKTVKRCRKFWRISFCPQLASRAVILLFAMSLLLSSR